MDRRRVAAGLLVTVLVLAGVGLAFPPTVPPDADIANGTDPATDAEPVPVEGGDLGVDQTALWTWTQDAMGRNVTETPTIRIEEFDQGEEFSLPLESVQELLLANGDGATRSGTPAAYSDWRTTTVHFDAETLSQLRNGTELLGVDGVLVHEYAHLVQYEDETVRRIVNSVLGLEDYYVSTAMIEGGANVVTDAYTDFDYLDRERARWHDANTTVRERLVRWPYYRGFAYLDARVDDPSDLWAIYDDPPESTATILRGDAPGDGPPERELTTRPEQYRVSEQGQFGAALTEIFLTGELEPARARTVAAGWQWDGFRSYRDADDVPGVPSDHVWVTEWRNESAADAFETAMTEYLNARWDREDGTWTIDDERSARLARIDGESLAFVAGSETFLANVSVLATDDGYAVASVTNASSDSTASAAPRTESRDGAPAARAGA